MAAVPRRILIMDKATNKPYAIANTLRDTILFFNTTSNKMIAALKHNKPLTLRNKELEKYYVMYADIYENEHKILFNGAKVNLPI